MGTGAVESETVAEKPKRGRPRATPAGFDRLWSEMEPGLSRRSYVNRYHQVRAARLLFADELGADGGMVPKEPAFAHFTRPGGGLRTVMLTELGRVEDDHDLVDLARIIGERRLPTGDAVALVRRFRLGDGAPDAARLRGAIAGAIAAHRIRYPATTPDDELAALEEVAAAVRRLRSKEQPG